VFEDFSNEEEGRVDAESEVTSEASPTPEEEAQTQADLEAAGIGHNEAEEGKKTRTEVRALYKDIKLLGEAHGAGKTSMIGLAERVTKSAMKRAIASKDAEDLYDRFREAAEKRGQLDDAGVIPDAAVIENAKIQTNEESRNAQVSKLRNFIELGNKFDETAYDLVRRARNIHLELLGKDRKTLKKGSTYTILVSVASANVKRNMSLGVMTDDEIHKHLYVPAPMEQPKDGVAKLEQALQAVQAAKKGSSGDKGREPISNPRLDTIITELRSAIGEEDPARLQAILDEEAREEAERIAKEDAKAERARKKAA
jgi:hypothetical protein